MPTSHRVTLSLRPFDEDRYDSVILVDASGVIQYWNKAAECLFGCPRPHAIGRSVASFLFFESLDVLRSGSSPVRVLDEAHPVFIRRLDGSMLPVAGELRRIDDADGVLVLLHLRSIAKQLAIRRLYASEPSSSRTDAAIAEIASLQDQLRRMQRVAAAGTLISGMAHDFNNVMTIVLGSLQELLVSPALVEEDRKRLTLAIGMIFPASRFIGRAISFGRSQEFTPQLIRLPELLYAMRPMLELVLGSHVSLTFELESLGQIRGDRSSIEQVVLNLAMNARDAMRRSGALHISLRDVELASSDVSLCGLLPGAHVEVRVRDTGPGIPPSLCEEIFQPFFSTKAEGKGTGLGLAMARSTMQLHHGCISVLSSGESGATFQLLFPVAASD